LEFSSWWQNIARADDVLEVQTADAPRLKPILYHGALLPNASGTLNPRKSWRARQTLRFRRNPQRAMRARPLLDGQALAVHRIPLGERRADFATPSLRAAAHACWRFVTITWLQFGAHNLTVAGETLPLTLYCGAQTNRRPQVTKCLCICWTRTALLRAQVDSIPKKRDAGDGNAGLRGEYVTDDYTCLGKGPCARQLSLQVGMYDENSGVRVPLKDANNTHWRTMR